MKELKRLKKKKYTIEKHEKKTNLIKIYLYNIT